MKKRIYLLIAFIGLSFCRIPQIDNEPNSPIQEIAYRQIHLTGVASAAKAEYSGLTWYNNWLVLLPQYPDKFDDVIFAISKDEINSYISSESTYQITPQEIKVDFPKNFEKQFPGYEGLEAIAFSGNQVYLTVEAEKKGDIRGYVIKGEIDDAAMEIKLDRHPEAVVKPQTDISNFSEEALLISGYSIYTIYEANGANLNYNPQMHVLSRTDGTVDVIPFPNIEYRITDATELDDQNRFWVMNYLWSGDREDLYTGKDALIDKYGLGETHSKSEVVERIIELKIENGNVKLTDRAPVYLQLKEGVSHNWEGIVKFDNHGFIIITDKYPNTILAFVPYKF
ncbi:MAG: hypothetical protein HN729_07300 [Candidatus Marinimicrobia bacterium]|jgi:hypothetical protein|nr:hypothetical protein [Candidatus Neomarinimicrobiota bacterium]MBT3633076.1 hypothetical protein [Candidatus Neomarinimicrobiota bacterium]MBT3682323.1 hypothetical protein [Candidatus Neomarinimicrobiota bacterium]MBT3758676.1 hypothetical protein [Candidatus Neomarinimicrobiota bacterium]MBT3895450.1 hypothetical protein [Candidatus Neomarinimicrobiota bacterium]